MTTPATSVSFNDSHWPLLLIRFTGTPTLEQYDAGWEASGPEEPARRIREQFTLHRIQASG
jgi:hypothetical protein